MCYHMKLAYFPNFCTFSEYCCIFLHIPAHFSAYCRIFVSYCLILFFISKRETKLHKNYLKLNNLMFSIYLWLKKANFFKDVTFN